MECSPVSATSLGHETFATAASEGNSALSEHAKRELAKGNGVLPRELYWKILSHRAPSADGSSARVCRLWNGLVNEGLPDPTLSVFGKEAWEEDIGFKVDGEVPPLPNEVYQTTRADRRRLAGVKEAPPCSACLMPKGLAAKKLKGLMEAKGIQFRGFWKEILDELGDVAIEKSYWFVMTNDVVEGSRNISYDTQKELFAERTGSGCQLPTLLEALACCAMHYKRFGKYLFGQNPWTYTRYQERIEGLPLVVGGFASGGLFVNVNFFVYGNFGAAACRRFC